MAGVRVPGLAMIGLLGPLVLIGIVVWVVRVTRRSDLDEDRGGPGLRRFLQYSFLLASLFTAANGLVRLLASALPAGVIAGRRAVDLALGLSLTLVAVPVWILLWRLVARRLREEPEERSAPAWALYLVTAATVSLIVAFVQLVDVALWLVGTAAYEPDAVASAVVWGAVWAAHTWLARRPGLGPTSGLLQFVVLAGSAVGLVALAIGTGGVLHWGLDALYGLVADSTLVDAAGDGPRDSLVLTVLAAGVWWWHWLHRGLAGARTTPWHAYVMLVAVFGGLVTAVTSGGIALYLLLEWLLGVPDPARVAVHFQPLPGAFAAAVVGAWVWWYHQAVLGDVTVRTRAEPERTYRHLVAAVGLVAAASGVTVAVMAALQAVTPGALATADPGGRSALAAAATLLLLGTPLWGTHWHRLQADVHAGAPAERRSASRRAYLSVLVGLAGLTAVVSLAVILYVVFRDVLEGNLAIQVLHELRAAIGLVLTAGTIAAYHWAVQRGDRAARGPDDAARRRTVLLVSWAGHRLASAVADGTGAKVQPLRRLDTGPQEQEIDADRVTAAILSSPHERVLVTVDEDGAVHVIPYERD